MLLRGVSVPPDLLLQLLWVQQQEAPWACGGPETDALQPASCGAEGFPGPAGWRRHRCGL